MYLGRLVGNVKPFQCEVFALFNVHLVQNEEVLLQNEGFLFFVSVVYYKVRWLVSLRRLWV